MPWFNVDDGFANSKPVLRIPRRYRCAAIGLWTLAGSWSAKELTDGFIPDVAIEEFAGTTASAEWLAKAGLWKKVDGGWQFEGWAKWQKTKERVLSYREREANKKRNARARNHPTTQVGSSQPIGWEDATRFLRDLSGSPAECKESVKVTCCEDETAGSEGVSPGDSRGTEVSVPQGLPRESRKCPAPPLPLPLPLPREEIKDLLNPDGSSDTTTDPLGHITEADYPQTFTPIYPQAFEQWWEHYPRKVGKRKALEAWKRARKRATDDQLTDGAKRYAADPNRADEFTKHPEGWLNRDGWLDEPIPGKNASAANWEAL